jgi:hypothetical protein
MEPVLYRGWLIESTDRGLGGYSFCCYRSTVEELPGSELLYATPQQAVLAARSCIDRRIAQQASFHCYSLFQTGQLAIEDFVSIERIILNTLSA